MLLNVNIPAGKPVKGYEITRLGRHTHGADVIEKDDPRGRKDYWIGGTGYEHVREPGTDVTGVRDLGRAFIAPLMLDLTEPSLLGPLEAWTLPGSRGWRQRRSFGRCSTWRRPRHTTSGYASPVAGPRSACSSMAGRAIVLVVDARSVASA